MALEQVTRKIQMQTSTKERIELHEPAPGASIEQIRLFNQHQHPQLATATHEITDENGVEVVLFKPNVGTRG